VACSNLEVGAIVDQSILAELAPFQVSDEKIKVFHELALAEEAIEVQYWQHQARTSRRISTSLSAVSWTHAGDRQYRTMRCSRARCCRDSRACLWLPSRNQRVIFCGESDHESLPDPLLHELARLTQTLEGA
jgi:hypothetical protein